MGFFSKLFGISSGSKSPTCASDTLAPKATVAIEQEETPAQETIKVPIMKPKQRYVLKIDGEYRVYSRKEDMPEQIRKEVDEMEFIADNASTNYTVYVDGKRINYKNLDDVPPEIKKVIIKSDLH